MNYSYLLELLTRDEAAAVADALRDKLPDVAERARQLSELHEPWDREERYGYCLGDDDDD